MNNNRKNNTSGGGGLGLGGVVGVVFIILKLVGVINWSWWWVLSPFWISLALTILIIVGLYLYYKWCKKKFKNLWK